MNTVGKVYFPVIFVCLGLRLYASLYIVVLFLLCISHKSVFITITGFLTVLECASQGYKDLIVVHPDSSFDWFGKSTTESTSVFQFNRFSPECWQNGRIIHCREEPPAWGQRALHLPAAARRCLCFSVCLCSHSDALCSMVQKRVNVTLTFQTDVLWVMQSCVIYLLLLFMLDNKCVLFFVNVSKQNMTSFVMSQADGDWHGWWNGKLTYVHGDEQCNAKLLILILFSSIIPCDILWMYSLGKATSIISKWNV